MKKTAEAYQQAQAAAVQRLLTPLACLMALVSAASVAALALTPASTSDRDIAVSLITIAFTTLVPLYGLTSIRDATASKTWLSAWWFSALVSACMPLPDVFLAQIVKSLHFPSTPLLLRFGGAVPITFALMWQIPLFMSLLPALILKNSTNPSLAAVAAHVAAGLFTATVFTSEIAAPHVGLWGPTDRVHHRVLGVAVYLVPGFYVMGLQTFRGHEASVRSGIVGQIYEAVVVMMLYTGAISCTFTVLGG